jgi:sialic acid synthase SpsE/quercetin dioxygenase-like cupin family protein
MKQADIFDNLLILDLANNHQGDLEHAYRVIDELVEEIDPTNNTCIKLQYRQLPEFVHESFRESKLGKRFIETKLDWEQYKKLCDHIRESGFDLAITPFDEFSVGMALDHGADILKVASCSADDWPLMEAVATAGKPVVISTGGLNQAEVDSVVSFFEHKGCDFALHHCVSIYPMAYPQAQLDTIRVFKQRYPNLTIGWSTHEDPEDTTLGMMAYAIGARMFERHVGLPDEEKGYSLNAYSATPGQIYHWANALYDAQTAVNASDRTEKEYPLHEEVDSLKDLKRGVYYDEDDKPYFAIPYNGISPNDLAERNMLMDMMGGCISQIKALFNIARIKLPVYFEAEYSHHHGVFNFPNTGTTMITLINRQYAKKYLVQLPNQRHPSHYHKIKEETFHVLYGELKVEIRGITETLKAGDTLTVPPGTWHAFTSKTGCIFEEISTKSIVGDSVYRDDKINAMTNDERKTKVPSWGRFVLKEKLNGEG